MIFWGPDGIDLKRIGDILIAIIGVFVLVAGILAFTHLDEPEKVSKPLYTLASTTTAATTTTTYVATTTTVEVTTTTKPKKNPTKSTTTTVAPITTTTVKGAATSTTVAVATTLPPPADTTAPSIGGLVSVPSVFYESPCSTSVRLSLSITDSSGIRSAKMFGLAMTRYFGTNTWSLTRQASAGLVPEGEDSISLSVPIVAVDKAGNSRSVSKSLVIHKCTSPTT